MAGYTEQRLIPFPSFLFPYFIEQWSSLHLFFISGNDFSLMLVFLSISLDQLDHSIPERCLLDSFQPSSPIRHVTELEGILVNSSTASPTLLLYTDGGPDHRLTYVSVQISLICVFLSLDLNFLCAVCTPPYHSWKNPAERIMSILDLGLQSVGVMRQETKSFEGVME